MEGGAVAEANIGYKYNYTIEIKMFITFSGFSNPALLNKIASFWNN